MLSIYDVKISDGEAQYSRRCTLPVMALLKLGSLAIRLLDL